MKAEMEVAWADWLKLNVERGCDRNELNQILVNSGIDSEQAVIFVTDALANSDRKLEVVQIEEVVQTEEEIQRHIAFSNGDLYLPKAARMDTGLAEIYGVHDFLSEEECLQIVSSIREEIEFPLNANSKVHPTKPNTHLAMANLNTTLIKEIDHRICRYMGIEDAKPKAIKLQWIFKENSVLQAVDQCEPGHSAEDPHNIDHAPCCWMFMVFLNNPRKGGSIFFPELDITFEPLAGTAIIWNNRMPSGEINPYACHQEMPVELGYKTTLTKEFNITHSAANSTKELKEYIPPLTRSGFLKARMPEHLFDSLRSFYVSQRHANSIEILPDYINTKNSKTPSVLIELTDELRSLVHQSLKPILEAWVGDELEPTFVFGIREYQRGSVLKVHRDRLKTHLVGVILNIDQDVDSSWPLYMEDHLYRGHEVFLLPGEMIFYEATRLSHGRPAAFDGDRFANVFAHFKLSD